MSDVVDELFAYLCVEDADKAVTFYRTVFEGRELFRLTEPSGRIGHLEMKLGSAVLMLTEPFPEFGIGAPRNGERSFCIHLHVGDCDEVASAAVAAGAEMIMEPEDQFYGERSCRIRDPFGHEWVLGHSIEELTPEEMQERYEQLFD